MKNKNNQYLKNAIFFNYWLKKFLPKNKKIFILDAGCGKGDFLFYIKKQGYNNFLGVDQNIKKVKKAKTITQKVIKKEINDFLETNKKKFDIIFALDLIEHLDKKESLKFLKLAKKSLMRKGILIIKTINGSSPFAGSYFWGDLTHKNIFTPNLLKKLMLKVGFKKIFFREVPPVPHGFLSLIRYLFWQIIKINLKFINLVETGMNHEIVSRNMIIAAYREQNPKLL
ncbi:MAG: methyltransferase domain-containing protein [Patescibacteria group bacterium]|nr:methyltransferase domain-containing protein [Patescibacteria group bacterium]